MTRIKICGITSWEDAKAACDAGADALGFNFYAPSPRYIAPDDAGRIVRKLPRRVQAVGVFVNLPADIVLEIARRADLDFLQLHGDESPRRTGLLARSFPVIKAFRAEKGFRVAQLGHYAGASAFLLDSFEPGNYGGTGRAFDWGIAKRAKKYGPVILAGGLTPANIARAILKVRPFAVDVCSGVEASPGKKDRNLLRKLMSAMESARGKFA
ncbi:MAG: phosphoribosylanthranilate isomerase [Candidatus Acidiferrales bacterium]